MDSLTGKQKRYLRGLGHALKPIVQLGKEGLSEGVVGAVNAALEQHELVKLKVALDGPEGREEVAAFLAKECDATLVQVLGGTVLLYKRHPKKPRLSLPTARETPATTRAAARPVGRAEPREDAEYDAVRAEDEEELSVSERASSPSVRFDDDVDEWGFEAHHETAEEKDRAPAPKAPRRAAPRADSAPRAPARRPARPAKEKPAKEKPARPAKEKPARGARKGPSAKKRASAERPKGRAKKGSAKKGSSRRTSTSTAKAAKRPAKPARGAASSTRKRASGASKAPARPRRK